MEFSIYKAGMERKPLPPSAKVEAANAADALRTFFTDRGLSEGKMNGDGSAEKFAYFELASRSVTLNFGPHTAAAHYHATGPEMGSCSTRFYALPVPQQATL